MFSYYYFVFFYIGRELCCLGFIKYLVKCNTDQRIKQIAAIFMFILFNKVNYRFYLERKSNSYVQ